MEAIWIRCAIIWMCFYICFSLPSPNDLSPIPETNLNTTKKTPMDGMVEVLNHTSNVTLEMINLICGEKKGVYVVDVLVLLSNAKYFLSPMKYPLTCLQTEEPDDIYDIQVNNEDAYTVSCVTNKGLSGWILIQSRTNGDLSFYRNWDEFRDGFGNNTGEFFIGLEKLYKLTNSQPYELLIDLIDFNDNVKYARYSNFKISSEYNDYKLESLGEYEGTAGDSLRAHLNEKFTTFDKDNHPSSGYNCAVKRMGGWWHNNCEESTGSTSSLNGMYLRGYVNKDMEAKGLYWESWLGTRYSLKSVEMMIRATDICPYLPDDE